VTQDFVESEIQRFNQDPATYLGELMGNGTILGADIASGVASGGVAPVVRRGLREGLGGAIDNPRPDTPNPPAANAPAPLPHPDAPSGPPRTAAPDGTNNAPPTGAPVHPNGQAERDTTVAPAPPAPRRVDTNDQRADRPGAAPTTSRRTDAVESRRSGNRFLPPDVRKRIEDGNEFNRQRRPYYPHNEVRLGNNKVVDSYVPGMEIVERKHTQLAEVRPETALGYLRMLSTKYAPGQRIANTPANRNTFAYRLDQLGQLISGQQVLEVPVQNAPVPSAVLDAAEALDIIIRDPNGKVYNP
jgi:hypothetical protein